jgi:hypothetical protein
MGYDDTGNHGQMEPMTSATFAAKDSHKNPIFGDIVKATVPKLTKA